MAAPPCAALLAALALKFLNARLMMLAARTWGHEAAAPAAAAVGGAALPGVAGGWQQFRGAGKAREGTPCPPCACTWAQLPASDRLHCLPAQHSVRAHGPTCLSNSVMMKL